MRSKNLFLKFSKFVLFFFFKRRLRQVYTVDVILPFHRNDSYLRVAINSILASRDVTVRLLLIDDRKDRSVIPDLDPYIIHRTGGLGYAAALNSAVPYLESDFVALMNSDDWSNPSRLIKQISALENSQENFSICSLIKFKNSHLRPALLGEFDCQEYDSRVLLLGAYGANATWLARRKTWVTSIYFENSSVSDWLSAMKIFPGLKIISVNEKLYWYRQHTSQITKSAIQQSESFGDLLYEASKIAKKTDTYDENFEMNFRITAAPYSLSTRPSRVDLLASWRYLEKIDGLDVLGTKNLILRRRFIVAIQLAQSGYFNFCIIRSIIIGAIDLTVSGFSLIFHRPPRKLREPNSLVVI